MENVENNNRASSPVVTIHQPNFAPWPGYFHKMMMVDVFIYLDNVPFSRNSFQNRNKILVNGVSQWLTVPVCSRGFYGEFTRDIQINFQTDWRRKHLATLRQNYGRSRWFEWVFSRLEPVYQSKEDLLYRFCIQINEAIRSMLDIRVPILLASEIADNSGATERLIALVKGVQGKTYLSGIGGRKYLEEKRFADENIRLVYQSFDRIPYPQSQSPFIPCLSTLDLLFNLGPDAVAWLRGKSYE